MEDIAPQTSLESASFLGVSYPAVLGRPKRKRSRKRKGRSKTVSTALLWGEKGQARTPDGESGRREGEKEGRAMRGDAMGNVIMPPLSHPCNALLACYSMTLALSASQSLPAAMWLNREIQRKKVKRKPFCFRSQQSTRASSFQNHKKKAHVAQGGFRLLCQAVLSPPAQPPPHAPLPLAGFLLPSQ